VRNKITTRLRVPFEFLGLTNHVSGISGPFELGCLSLNHSENHENINNNNTNESNNNNNDSSNDQNGHLQALLLSNYDKHTYNPTYAPGIYRRKKRRMFT